MGYAYQNHSESGGGADMRAAGKAMRFEVPAAGKKSEQRARLADPLSFEAHTPLERNLPASVATDFKTKEKRAKESKFAAPAGDVEVFDDMTESFTPDMHQTRELEAKQYVEKRKGGKLDAMDRANIELLETENDLTKIEITAVREKTEKTGESWFRSLTNNAKKIADGAGQLLREAGQVMKEEWEESAIYDYGKNILSLRAQKGEYIKISELDSFKYKKSAWVDTGKPNAVIALAREIGTLPNEALKGMWEIGDTVYKKVVKETLEAEDLEQENFRAQGLHVDAFIGASEILSNLATAAGLGREGQRGMAREVWDRAIEAPAFITSEFVKNTIELGGKLAGNDKKEFSALLQEIQAPAKDYSPEADWTTDLVGSQPESNGTGPKNSPDSKFKYAIKEAAAGTTEVARFALEGVTSYASDLAKTLGWTAEQYRIIESLPRQGAETNQQAELAHQVLEAGRDRLNVAAAEMAEISQDGVKAKVSLIESVVKARDNFEKMIDANNAKRLKLARQISQDKAGGFGVELLKQEKSTIERQNDKYRDALEALKKQEKTENEAQMISNTEARETYQDLIKEAERKLKALNASLKNPDKYTGYAKDFIKDQMNALEADLDKYESIVSALDQLDNLTPDTKKESVAA